MVKNMSRKLAVVCMVVGATLSTQKAQAQWVVSDPAVLIETIYSTLESAYQWAEERSILLSQMDQSGVLAELEVDNTNNAMANVIVRTGAALQEIQNIEAIEMAVPDRDVCQTVSTVQFSGAVACEAASEVAEKTENFLHKHSDFTSPQGEQVLAVREIARQFVENCSALHDGDFDPHNPIRTSMCTRASILTGGATADTYTPMEQKAVDYFIDLIAGPLPTLKDTGSYIGADEARNESYIREMRLESFRAIVNTSLHEVASMRRSPGGNVANPSPLQILTEFDNQRFGDPAWVLSVSGGREKGQGGGETIMPSEIRRKMAVMDAFKVHMMVLQYKQQLRQEVVMTAILANQINPAK